MKCRQYPGDPTRECRCLPSQVPRYRRRLSGLLLYCIDLHIEAPALSLAELRADQLGEASAAMRPRVDIARRLQLARFTQHLLEAIQCRSHVQGVFPRVLTPYPGAKWAPKVASFSYIRPVGHLICVTTIMFFVITMVRLMPKTLNVPRKIAYAQRPRRPAADPARKGIAAQE